MAKKLVDSIQMEVRSVQPCRREFDFTVPAEAIKSETAKTLADFARAVSVPGFRQGKAPLGMLRTKYASDIKEELQRRIIYAAYEMASGDKSLDIVTCGVEGEPASSSSRSAPMSPRSSNLAITSRSRWSCRSTR